MSMQQAKMGPRVARGCVWCEPLGGNVTAAALLTEWGATLLARELAGIVAEAGAQRGGAAYLGKRDALADLGRRLDRDGDGAASRSLAAFLTEYRRGTAPSGCSRPSSRCSRPRCWRTRCARRSR